jgi:hypothetical protein
LPEFLVVDGFEFLDRLAAQLAWGFHDSHPTGAVVVGIDGWICRYRQTLALSTQVCHNRFDTNEPETAR